MPSDEENERDGLDELKDAAGSPEGSGPGPAEVVDEPATGAEKKERKLWPLALALTLLVLGGGGFYALTGLKDTAHKLGGGSEYDQLAANSSVYDGKAGAHKQLDVFAGGGADGGEGAAGAAGEAGSGRLNPALTRDKELSAAAGGGSSAGSRWEQGEEESEPADNASAQAPQRAGSMAQKLRAKAFLPGGAGAAKSKAVPGGSAAAFEGSGTLVGKGSVQRETKDRTPKKGAKGSVMDSLKGAFKASLYGARLSSQDSAKEWISRTFDATPEADMAIEYDEKVKSKLDRVNPGAIPNFLRDQEVSAAEAKRLADSKVSKPKLDSDGTREALAEDKDYQQKKMAQDFAGSMINSLFAGVSGTGTENPDDRNAPADDDGGGFGSLDYGGDTQGYGGFADPEDTQAAVDSELADWVDTYGYGAECGCTEAAPCCCMPQDTVAQNCPMYGPFLPGDPCDFTANSGASVVTAP